MKLLVLTTRYPHPEDPNSGTFIKSRVDSLSKYSQDILVVATLPYVPMFLAKLMHPKRIGDALARDYSYGNVTVKYVHTLVFPGALKKRWGESAFSSVKKMLETEDFKPDIIHAHRTWPPGYVAMRLKQEFELPYIVTGHGHDAYGLAAQDKWKTTLKQIFGEADGITTVSQKNKDVMVKELDLKQDSIEVVPNGYDPKLFKPMSQEECRKKLSLPLNCKLLVSVAHLDAVKDHVSIVEALQIMKEEGKLDEKLKVALVGSGPERHNILKRMERYGLQNHFILVGAKPHSEIPLWINASDAFILPSKMEGIPTVLFEAMGCGKPFVGSSVGGIPDVVNDDVGILTEPGNPQSLAKGMCEVLEKRWEEKFIVSSVQKYVWEDIVKSDIGIYDRVLEPHLAQGGDER